MSALSVGMQAYGAVQNVQAAREQVQANNAAVEAQNAANAANANAAELQARQALKVGADEEQRAMLRTAMLKSDQRASMAARGLSLEEGSMANILESTDFMSQVDYATIRQNAQQQAWGYREQAKNYLKANRSKSSSSTAESAALLTGIGSVAKSWMAYKKAYPDEATTDWNVS